MRLASAGFVVLLAPAGAFMSAGAFVALVTTVCVAQVLFDLMMAPLEADAAMAHEEHARHLSTPDHAPQAPPPRRFRIGDAIRRGTPSEFRRDLYFFFMEGNWYRFFASFVFVYLLSNLVFACFYLLEPGSIQGARDASFGDAFFFSVQTMSTIGYGALSPASDYGNVLVIVEACYGLLFAALTTGLIFAKASRAHSSVMFSDAIVITRHEGRRVFSFRCGNARGNEVVEASMRVAVLRDEISPEGYRMRRLHDLPLQRDNSPLFTLSWSVMHTIDADSCLHDVDFSDPDSPVVGIICTMLGYDSTYAQTVHARHIYYPEHVRVGYRFRDVISADADGRMVIDFTRFHDVEPDPADDGRAAGADVAPAASPALSSHPGDDDEEVPA